MMNAQKFEEVFDIKIDEYPGDLCDSIHIKGE